MDLQTEKNEEKGIKSLLATSPYSYNANGAAQHDMAACNGFAFRASENQDAKDEACDSKRSKNCKKKSLPGRNAKVNEEIKDNLNVTINAPLVTKVFKSHVSSLPKLMTCKLLCADYRSCSSTTDSESESVSVSDSKSESESDSESSSTSDVGSDWKSEDSETESSMSSNDSEDSSRKKKEKGSDTDSQSSKKRGLGSDLAMSDLPPIENLRISVPEDECVEIGVVTGIVNSLVVIEAYKGTLALDIDTVLFLDKGEKSLGRIFDVIGPVSEPVYIVRFNNAAEIAEANVMKNDKVYCAPKTEYSSFVFVSELMKMKGSDASWKNNKEVPLACQDFSDDEEERQFRALLQNSEDAVKPVSSAKNSPKKKTSYTPQLNAPVNPLRFQNSSLTRTPMNQYPVPGMHPQMYPMPNPYVPFFNLPPPPPPPPPPCQIPMPPPAQRFPGNNFCNPTQQPNVKPNYIGPVTNFNFNFPYPAQRHPFPNQYYNYPGQLPPNPGINSYDHMYGQYKHPQHQVPPTPQNPYQSHHAPPPPCPSLPLRQPLPPQKPFTSQGSMSPPYQLAQTTPISSPQMPMMPPQQPFPNRFVTTNEILKPRTVNVQLAPNL